VAAMGKIPFMGRKYCHSDEENIAILRNFYENK
jgi:hypothetical protein